MVISKNKLKNIIGVTLSWIFGLIFGITGLIALITGSFISGLVLLLISFILLPPTVKLMESKMNIKLSKKIKTLIIFVLIVIFFMSITNTNTNPNVDEDSKNLPDDFQQNDICETGEYGTSDCPNCDDNNKCTKDSINYDTLTCVNEAITPCCGNGKAETGETCSSCKDDIKCSTGTQCCSGSCKDICTKDSDCISNDPIKEGTCTKPNTCNAKCSFDISISAIESNAETVLYDDLFRYNEKYINTPIVYEGEIIQTGGSSKNYYYRIDITKTILYGTIYYEDTIYVLYDGTERFLESDIVKFYGVVTGIKSYTSVLGAIIEIPEIKVYKIELITKAGDRT